MIDMASKQACLMKSAEKGHDMSCARSVTGTRGPKPGEAA